MKGKWLALLLALVMLITVTACGKKEDETDSAIVAAVETLEKHWTELYRQTQYAGVDGYFEIKNTRKIEIRDTVSVNDTAKDMFDGVDYIVEFVVFTEYYPQAYVSQAPLNSHVIVYDDGRVEVGGDLLTDYSRRTYSFDYSGIVESVEDYDDKYNCQKNLKE